MPSSAAVFLCLSLSLSLQDPRLWRNGLFVYLLQQQRIGRIQNGSWQSRRTKVVQSSSVSISLCCCYEGRVLHRSKTETTNDARDNNNGNETEKKKKKSSRVSRLSRRRVRFIKKRILFIHFLLLHRDTHIGLGRIRNAATTNQAQQQPFFLPRGAQRAAGIVDYSYYY